MYRIFIVYFFLSTSSCADIDKNNSAVKHRYFWRDYTGVVPKDAFNVTDDLYIGQVILDGVMVGGFYPNSGTVVTEYGGRKTAVRNTIKILCDRRKDNFEWERVRIDDLSPQKLKNMVVGGFEDGTITYIGRVFLDGQWKVGKVFPPVYPLEGLNVWNKNGYRYRTQNFQILRYLDKDDTKPANQVPAPTKWFDFDKCWFD